MSSSTPLADEYRDLIVNKPWGYEYLMYQNDFVGLWYLYIRPGGSTSLHCHPRKKTGLVLLSGEAKVTYLNDFVTLKAVSKLMIRPGLFHSTAALSPEGIVVLEIETPREKENLVRLEDHYGREEEPYEGAEAMEPITSGCLRLDHPEPGCKLEYKMHGCTLGVENVDKGSALIQRPEGETIIVLAGGLYSTTGEPILAAGDVVSTSTLSRLMKSFSAPHGITMLAVQKEG